MRGLYLLFLLAFVGFGSWWLVDNSDTVHQLVRRYTGGEREETMFLALEPRFSVDQLMNAHRDELPDHRRDDRLSPTLKLYPYLLLDVTYNRSDKKGREGVILWSLDDGEMILDTDSWDSTHGFNQLIAMQANEQDYKVIKALASRGGKVRRDQLIRVLNQPSDVVDEWVDNAMSKRLVIQDGNNYRLRNPDVNIDVAPITIISQRLVTKPYNHAVKQTTKYSKEEIQEAVEAVFAPNVTIRDVHEVFLPVYSIALSNRDGTVQSVYWNALNGKKYTPKDRANSR